MLDSFLLKPVNSRFLISIRNMSISSLGNCFFGIGVVVYSINKLGITIGVGQVLGYILLILSGILIMHSILFIASTTAIFFVKTGGLINTVFDIFQFGMKPDVIYNRITKIILTYIFPVLLIFNLPAKFLLNKITFESSLWGILFALTLVIISNYFWKVALRRYSSVSS
jgi:ABC-2 type transport system permease protein